MPYSPFYILGVIAWGLSSLSIQADAGEGAIFGHLSASGIDFIGGDYVRYQLPLLIEWLIPMYWGIGLLCLLTARVRLITAWFLLLIVYQLGICTLVDDSLLWLTVSMFLIPYQLFFAGLFIVLSSKRHAGPGFQHPGSLGQTRTE